ncbi:MAG: bifunctional diaminohydroxyphosphoribosylaminopyrimidine deaminase/5-amino-6-(5-phosphoribosylamino)uracil reductase RibD, partial [Ottowia sp.]|nr:bifunctional diaminohydroxyphosphoribosylaminopyrimidine deaminase/5-amino-6-(5-phosphoribosylamino)uracil reductase RibD [Ottowia sp.]
MARALDLARKARFICPPNPAVGCVLASAAGDIIGSGHTQRTGEAHAEIMALRDAAEHGQSTAGATAYVTLEPCAHHGRTAPCCDALIAAGVRRVLAAAVDPNPLVAGRGFARLREAGVQVDMADEATLLATRALNIGFFRRMERGWPWVRLKTAASLDGRTALPGGASQWITGEA